MSEISSTISPISSDDSPRRLIRFGGVLDLRADFVHARDLVLHRLAALLGGGQRLLRHRVPTAPRVCDTSLIDCAICSTDADACWISLFCRCDASKQPVRDRLRVRSSPWPPGRSPMLMPLTSVRSSSIVKLIESAMAPVTSSVTEACTVRSPSARFPISFSSRRIASWLRLFSPFALERAHARCRRRNDLAEQHQRRAARATAKTMAAPRVQQSCPRSGSRSCSASLVVSASSGSDSLVDAARRLLGDDQPLHVLQDRVDAGFVRGEALLQLGQRRRALPRCVRRDKAQRLAALEQPVQDVAERAGVLAEQERDLGIDFVGRHQRVGVLRDPLREHRELIREIDLAQAAAAGSGLGRDACCASSSSALLPWLIPSRPLDSETSGSAGCRARRSAFFSTRSQRLRDASPS